MAINVKPKPLTPPLRFSEFKGEPPWMESKLDDVISTVTPPKKLLTASYLSHGTIPVIDQSPQAVCGWTNDVEAIVESPLPVIVFGDHTCVLKLVRQPFAQGADGIKIFRSEPTVDTEYLYHNLSRRPLVMEDYKRHFSILKERRVHYPDPRTGEQRKIAACLTSLDELLAAESRKVEALRAHKKGLMQQLFPRPGEPCPRLRFPEFREAGGWGVAPFNELYMFIPTNTFSRDQLSYREGTIKNIHYGDIHTKFAATFRIGRERVPYVAPSTPLGNIKAESFCREGDMIFADASEDLADVGKSIELVELDGEQVLSGSHTILARPLDDTFAIGFGAYLFKSRGVRAQIQKEAQGTKVMAISPVRLGGIDVRYPVDKAEQQRIVTCLASLDALIGAESQKMDSLRAHKKGLMQQLFPVAGRV